tara:strand:- start:2270 stop:4531 length:2262 start_codon:yes stop_codon:yes gene_type:complete
MNKIFKIAKIELNILFYSPIAWLVLILFLLQCGLTFIDLIDARETSQQLGSNLKGLTEDIFGGNKGFFSSVQDKLYLYIPLLTMGLISKELHSGSIKLLFSSPVTSTQIILGKFLAMALYGLLLVGILLLIVGAGTISIENLDFQYLLGGILGLYLLLCAYSSIGLFMSSLTSYQVVAAISTLAVLAALNYVGTIGQSIDFVRDITYWISISGRADNFINGLITSKDLIYFLLIIGLFLFLTVMRFDRGRKQTSQFSKVSTYVILVVGVLMLGYLSSLPFFDIYYDTTRFKKKTLTNSTLELIDRLEEPIHLTTYVNVLNGYAHIGAPKYRIFEFNQFSKFTRFIPEIEISYVAYYDSTYTSRDETIEYFEEEARKSAVAYGYDFNKVLSPEEIRAQIDLSDEKNFFVRKMTYKGKSTSLRMFYDQIGYPQEAEVAASIKRLLDRPKRVGFLSLNGERDILRAADKSYYEFTSALQSRSALVNQGFDMISIDMEASKNPLDSIDILVIADPITSYSEQQITQIKTFLENGGNALIAGEPGKDQLLQPILDYLGVQFTTGIMLQESEKYELDLIQTKVVNDAESIGISLGSKDIISYSGTLGVKALPNSDFKVTPLLRPVGSQVWRETLPVDLTTDSLSYSADKSIEPTLSLALSRKINGQNQRIIVSGDADFMSNGEIKRFNLTNKNGLFTTKIFRWLSNDQFPIDITRKEAIDNKIKIDQQGIWYLQLFFMILLPVVLAIAGITLLIKRKRQ